LSDLTQPRRPYDNRLRRARAAETRERIVSAAAEIVHGFPLWNWSALTTSAVAKRAGVNGRTVYRHFANERALRDAVLLRLVEEEAGINLDSLTLETLVEHTLRIFKHVSTYPVATQPPRDPALATVYEHQQTVLREMVGSSTDGWSTLERTLAAAVVDVLWSTGPYERLLGDWNLRPTQAIRAITWAVALVEDALRNDHRPVPVNRLRTRNDGSRRARKSNTPTNSFAVPPTRTALAAEGPDEP
jgi:AcrR family transcriptional regulator